MNDTQQKRDLVLPPGTLLPDPRTEVIVRRVLGDRECSLWYPGNQEALAYNQSMRGLLHSAPTTRQGVLSEGDVERGNRSRGAMVFRENGMRVVDVEVLKVVLEDQQIRTLLDQAQHDVVRANIDLSNQRREL